jgi:tRNA dimethylallyltransferase
MIYLCPDWDVLRGAIDERSKSIARAGLDEARIVDEMERVGNPPNPSVEFSIGVRELRDHLHGNLSIQAAEERIAVRTRRLARRQIRWFDKLTRSLHGKARSIVAKSPNDPQITHIMHDIMGA